jgi:hydrogenase maturation protein HypF
MQVPAVKQALRIRVTGVVQGVGFRPFVYRLARDLALTGWVLNGGRGVEIHAEGEPDALDRLTCEILEHPPSAARVASCQAHRVPYVGYNVFAIRRSARDDAPTVRVCHDLPVCGDCLRELFDPADRRYRYPYINCTNCGPRYSIVRGLPYDRAQTTMRDWPMCDACTTEYEDPLDRRFHAQPVACPRCGPLYTLKHGNATVEGDEAFERGARLLSEGAIVAIKGIGGYHLACDARNATAVAALRERKYRKERPFALMVPDEAAAEAVVNLSPQDRALLTSSARPIVIAPAAAVLREVAPQNADFGVMLAYTPVHHLLFAAGAPAPLVMTSANRSSEPIAYRDGDALLSLAGIADAFLIGTREIARRVDDSVVRSIAGNPSVIRHARGYAPQAVATLPTAQPILAVGADLKNAIALVVDGQAFVSQYVGDLEYLDAFESFRSTIDDLCALYDLPKDAALVVHDAHPEYRSSSYAAHISERTHAVQHHRAHVASVLAEREAYDERVLGFAFDGTGYGEDGTIWGGEIFAGSLRSGLARVAHLRPALLPGGDAAARAPVQAAAGFLQALDVDPRLLERDPFCFPARYGAARELLRANVRVFPTTSMGRLFDTAAALLGFTREITFEAQAAMWLEQLAAGAGDVDAYPFPFDGTELDYRPLLDRLIADRRRGRDVREIARAFHRAAADGILQTCEHFGYERVVVSGGVFQNALLTAELYDALGERLWANRIVPANDGGIALGQAAIAAFDA